MTTEKPLAPQARGALVFAAAIAILAFYAAAVVSMVVLAALLLLGVIVLVGAARVGLAGFVGALMAPANELLQIFFKKLWLPADVNYRITLAREDAPRLFRMVEDLAGRMGVAPPATIVVEMHNGAWVMLKGFRRASGNTMLGIGYDLLAGLNTAEIEGVLAHELAHALLVDRGFSRWLNKGLARLVAVSQAMSELNIARANAKQPSDLAKWGAKLFDAITIRAARLVATYSRQDEFEADWKAAETCGPEVMRSALLKLETLDDATARLPWSERVARLQPGENFSEWLVAEIARLTAVDHDEPVRHAVDPYSTHPTLRDRIAALLADPGPIPTGEIGIGLLADPDRIAGRLVAEIERVAWKQEQRNTKQLARETRKLVKREDSSALGAIGVIAIAFGVIIGIIAVGGGMMDAWATAIVSLVVGVIAYRAGAYRDRLVLPVPKYGTFSTWKPFETQEALAAAEQAIYDELEGSAMQAKKRQRLARFVSEAYAALEKRDYLRAHVASRLALQIKSKSVEASLAYAIAAGGIGNAEQAQLALGGVKKVAGFTSPSTCWGAAWALVMLNDGTCEGLLQRLHDSQPKVATYAALLAWAQLIRGKLQSAIANARTARALEPDNDAITQLLIGAFLQTGRVREAAELVASIEDTARKDADAAFLMVRVKLLSRDLAAAQEWAAVLRGLDTDGQWLIALGTVFASARLDEPAGTFFSDALATEYTPQANVGLAVLAVIGGDRTRAKQHLLAGLKIERRKLTRGQTPFAMFHEIIARLNGLEERRVRCKAWIAAIPAESATSLSGASLFVCAPDESAAKAHLAEIIAAMHESETPFDSATVAWSEAPTDQQPLRPVQPGVQYLIT